MIVNKFIKIIVVIIYILFFIFYIITRFCFIYRIFL